MYNIFSSYCSQLPSFIFTPCHSSLSEQDPLLLSCLFCVCSLHLTSWTWMGVIVYLNKGRLSVATPLEGMSLHSLQWSAACSTSGISAALGAHPHPWWKVDGPILCRQSLLPWVPWPGHISFPCTPSHSAVLTFLFLLQSGCSLHLGQGTIDIPCRAEHSPAVHSLLTTYGSLYYLLPTADGSLSDQGWEH